DDPLIRIGAGFMDKAGEHIDENGGTRPTYSLVYVLRGRGVYTDARGQNLQLTPGWCFLRRPGRAHHLVLDPESRWMECWLDCGPLIYQTLQRLHCLPGPPDAWPGEPVRDLMLRHRALIDGLAAADDEDLPQMLAQFIDLHARMAATARPPQAGSDTALVAAACRFLADPRHRHLGLQAFCGEHGVGYERFRKRFRAQVGCSPERYRIRRRLEEACRLLETTDHSIAAISEELGYSSPFDFSAQFRRYLGMSPSAYRGSGRGAPA
ncbi:MAG: helix-turn-helix domain-containing protein, partial [Planctomycetota bacterium]